jgi:hypothetical protein
MMSELIDIPAVKEARDQLFQTIGLLQSQVKWALGPDKERGDSVHFILGQVLDYAHQALDEAHALRQAVREALK